MEALAVTSEDEVWTDSGAPCTENGLCEGQAAPECQRRGSAAMVKWASKDEQGLECKKVAVEATGQHQCSRSYNPGWS